MIQWLRVECLHLKRLTFVEWLNETQDLKSLSRLETVPMMFQCSLKLISESVSSVRRECRLHRIQILRFMSFNIYGICCLFMGEIFIDRHQSSSFISFSKTYWWLYLNFSLLFNLDIQVWMLLKINTYLHLTHF